MNKKFIIEAEMDEHWVPCFLSMLKKMEYNGDIGHSGTVALYADGDGDFRPKFKFSIPYKEVKPIIGEQHNYAVRYLDGLYDAG